MLLERWLSPLLAGAVCVALAVPLATLGHRPLVLMRASALSARTAPSVAAPELSGFAEHMTPDDVARGVWALAEEQGGVALTDAQRAALAPMLAEGGEARARVSELRARRQAAETAWLNEGMVVARTLGTGRALRVAR